MLRPPRICIFECCSFRYRFMAYLKKLLVGSAHECFSFQLQIPASGPFLIRLSCRALPVYPSN